MFHLQKISPDHMIRRCLRLAYTRSLALTIFQFATNGCSLYNPRVIAYGTGSEMSLCENPSREELRPASGVIKHHGLVQVRDPSLLTN